MLMFVLIPPNFFLFDKPYSCFFFYKINKEVSPFTNNFKELSLINYLINFLRRYKVMLFYFETSED